MPPPVNCGERIEPWRARPVPFCRYGLRPPPETIARLLTAAVPRRFAAACATTAAWIRSERTVDSKILGSSSMATPLQLDLYVDPGRQLELHQRVDGLSRGVEDVDEALMRPHLELLAGLLVDVRTAQ